MSRLDLSGVHGPAIERDEHTAPFFDAAGRDELLLQCCAGCGHWLGPQASACTGCGGDQLSWEPASGAATLITWAVVHSAPHRAFADQLPYVAGYVQLSEGPWLIARIVGAAPERLQVGTALDVAFVHPTEGESYPAFVPAPAN